MRFIIVIIALLAASPALAEQPDITDLQRAIASLQAQRNQAADVIVNYEVRVAKLADENAKLKAENDELKKKADPGKAQ